MPHSTSGVTRRKSTNRQSAKAELPKLWVHTGKQYWAKKIKGQIRYFGKVADDPDGIAALEQYLREKHDYENGRIPQGRTSIGLSMKDLADRFYTAKKSALDLGEISQRSFDMYDATCEQLVAHFGRTFHVENLTSRDASSHFEKLRVALASGDNRPKEGKKKGTRGRKRGAVALRNIMIRVRSVFAFAYKGGLIEKPVVYGESFQLPKLKTIRMEREQHRNKHGDRMFEAAEIRKIIASAPQPLKAMVLLACNCAFGQSDISQLPIRCVDLNKAVVDFARVKTAVGRVIPLWPETVAAIREWLPMRPKARNTEDEGLMFVTKHGHQWVKSYEGGANDAIGSEFNKLVKELKLKRARVGFYALRHTFETIGGETTDQVAVNAIMGHVDRTMAGSYRERISIERKLAVTNHVREWLFNEKKEGEQ